MYHILSPCRREHDTVVALFEIRRCQAQSRYILVVCIELYLQEVHISCVYQNLFADGTF